MDAILKTFPFGLIFRGVFPGGFFVLSYFIASEGWDGLEDQSEHNLSLWLSVAVFSGVIVYTLHRSIVYPWIECLLDNTETFRITGSCCCRLIREDTVKRLMNMWSTGECKTPGDNIARHVQAWNDYIHLQYASAWCIVAAAVFHVIIKGTAAHQLSGPLAALVVVLVVSAFVSDWRLRTVSREAIHIQKKERRAT